jgi:DGQHR domain-containing protein
LSIKKKKKKRKKKILTTEEKEKKKFHEEALTLFKRMGFEYIRTEGKEVKFGKLTGEFDSVFLFENIILICEETLGKNRDHDHLRKKYDFFEEIELNKAQFLLWIRDVGKEKFGRFTNYSDARYKVFYIYLTKSTIEEAKRDQYNKFKYIDLRNFRYFIRIADSIRYSARNEFYKFLQIDFKQVGIGKASSLEHIQSAVIVPEDVTGMHHGIQLVSFVMTAKQLLDCAFVFRKENWDEDSGYYYQRLIDKKKIQSIREFLAREKRTFLDSIIVSLPSNVTFHSVDEDGNEKGEIDPVKISEVTSNSIIKIPYRSNSIGIIDGQHRVFGHHEAPESKEETIISELRVKRHLFVTGLFYPKGRLKESDKRKFESKLFLEINSKQKKVGAQVLQYIESLQDPLSPIGLSMAVIQRMNQRSPFLNHFLLSELDASGIKTPTIIQYGLQFLVEIDDQKETLFKYWNGQNKNSLITEKDSDEAEEVRKKYSDYCADTICKFFIAVKNNFTDAWTLDGSSKLMTVTSLVAFLKSFGRSLEVYHRVEDIGFYQKKIQALKMNFKDKRRFPYVSSQWPKFAEVINECWTP